MDIQNTTQSSFGGEALSTNKFEDYLQKPYFYTYDTVTSLQDHLATRKKQLSIWCYLLMTYFVKQSKTEGFKSELLHDSFSLFNNTMIRREIG